MRAVTREDLELVYSTLRAEEFLQAQAEGIEDVLLTMCESALGDGARAYAVTAGDSVVALSGVRENPPEFPRVWLLCTEDIKKHRLSGIRLARETLAKWLEQYGFLWNVVDKRQPKAIDFLEVMGARFAEPLTAETGFLLVPFYFAKEDWAP